MITPTKKLSVAIGVASDWTISVDDGNGVVRVYDRENDLFFNASDALKLATYILGMESAEEVWSCLYRSNIPEWQRHLSLVYGGEK